MKIKFYANGGKAVSHYQFPGTPQTDFVKLVGTNTASIYAAPKQYVDTAFSDLDTNALNQGTAPLASVAPSITGDFSKKAIGDTLIAKTAVVAGSYASVTVNAKGLVTYGKKLVSADVPSFDWSKVSEVPSTAGGFGITDALLLTGATVVGNVTLPDVDENYTELLSTKKVVDQRVEVLQSHKIRTGDVSLRPSFVAQPNYLRCNGAELAVDQYPTLFEKLGSVVSVPGKGILPGSGIPWQAQYTIHANTSAEPPAWTTIGDLPLSALCKRDLVYTKNRVYLLGGMNNWSSYFVYTATLSEAGVFGPWTQAPFYMPTSLANGMVCVVRDTLYYMGGIHGGAKFSKVYKNKIDANGLLSTFVELLMLPFMVYNVRVFATKKRLYIVGGKEHGAGLSYYAGKQVWYTETDVAGNTGDWFRVADFPIEICDYQVILTRNRVYLVGGCDFYYDPVNKVYTAPIDTEGVVGAWTLSTPLPSAVVNHRCFTTNGFAYLLGGWNTAFTQLCYKAAINPDGTLGTWQATTPLRKPLGGFELLSHASGVYLFSGKQAGSRAENAGDNLSLSIEKWALTGGITDTLTYTNINRETLEGSKFLLPDMTAKNLPGYEHYIKP